MAGKLAALCRVRVRMKRPTCLDCGRPAVVVLTTMLGDAHKVTRHCAECAHEVRVRALVIGYDCSTHYIAPSCDGTAPAGFAGTASL